MLKKFQVIVADPPWNFSDSLKMSDVARSASSNYNTMSISDIKNLQIKNITDPNGAILALWVPSSLLQEGLDVMKEWGFKHKQTYIWVKVKKSPLKNKVTQIKSIFKKATPFNYKSIFTQIYKILFDYDLATMLSFGMGRLFRQTHEICLIGISNNKIYKLLENKSQRSVSLNHNFKHSKKPDHLQKSLEIMFPQANKLEIFARRERDGWICLGNEVCGGEDITESLAKLL